MKDRIRAISAFFSQKKLQGAVLLLASFYLLSALYSLYQPYTPLKKADAIVLLAGNQLWRGPAAAFLYNCGYADRVILTSDGVLGGWSTKYRKNLYQVDRAEEDLVAFGVPRENIVKLPFHKSGTFYDALAVRLYAREHGVKSMILVSSNYHLCRALWCFRRLFPKEGVELMVYSADSSPAGISASAVELCKFAAYMVMYGYRETF